MRQILVLAFYLNLFAFHPSAFASCNEIQQVLGCIPNSTEVLIIAREPYELGVSNPKLYDVVLLCRDFTTNILYQLGKGRVFDEFTGKKVSFSIEACERIRGHVGETFNGFDGGQVVVFEDDLTESNLASIRSFCKKQIQIRNYSVGIFPNTSAGAKQNHNLFVCIPRPNLMVLGLEQSFVEKFLENLDKGTKSKWFDIELEVKDTLLAVRLYSDSSTDIASPFQESRYFSDKYADPKAKALTMQFTGYRPRAVEFKYYGSISGANLIELRLNSPLKLVRNTLRKEMCSEFEIRIPEDEQRPAFVVIVMGLFGHTFIDDM